MCLNKLSDFEWRASGQTLAIGIVYLGNDKNLAALGVDRALGTDYATFPGMGLCADSCRDPNPWARRPGGTRVITIDFGYGHELQLAVAQREPDFDVVHRVDAGHNAAGGDELADIHVAFKHSARIGRHDCGPFEIQPGLDQPGPRRVDGGARTGELWLSQHQIVRLTLLAQPRPIAPGLIRAGLFLGQGGAGLRQVGSRNRNVRLAVPGIDSQQHITLLEKPAHSNVWRQLHNASGDFRDQGALGSGAHRATGFHLDEVIRARNGHDLDLGHSHPGRAPLRRLTIGHRDDCHGAGAGDHQQRQ